MDLCLIVEPSLSIFRKPAESHFVFAAPAERNPARFFLGREPKPIFSCFNQESTYFLCLFSLSIDLWIFCFFRIQLNDVFIFLETSQTSSMRMICFLNPTTVPNGKQNRRTIRCTQRVSNITGSWLHDDSRLGVKGLKRPRLLQDGDLLEICAPRDKTLRADQMANFTRRRISGTFRTLTISSCTKAVPRLGIASVTVNRQHNTLKFRLFLIVWAFLPVKKFVQRLLTPYTCGIVNDRRLTLNY